MTSAVDEKHLIPGSEPMPRVAALARRTIVIPEARSAPTAPKLWLAFSDAARDVLAEAEDCRYCLATAGDSCTTITRRKCAPHPDRVKAAATRFVA